MIKLTLPYPPTVNHYWGFTRTRRGIRSYITQRGIEFRNAVAQIASPENLQSTISTPVKVWAQVWMPDNRRRDIDNLSKGLLDSLAYAGVYQDDCLVHDFRITRMGLDRDSGGRVEVSVEELAA